MIILEGPDGAGKSTLAIELQKRFNSNIVHSPGQTTLSELNQRMEVLYNSNKNDIFDRCPVISEFVYTKAELNDDMKIDSYLENTFNELIGTDHLIIYCRPSDPSDHYIIKTLEENARSLNTQHSLETLETKADRLIREYDELIMRLMCQGACVWNYDIDRSTVDQMADLIEKYYVNR